MMRTTLDIDAPLLRDLKRLQKKEGKTLGRLMSDLLADALGRRSAQLRRPAALHWTRRAMGARVDLHDKEAIYAALDEPIASPPRPRRRA